MEKDSYDWIRTTHWFRMSKEQRQQIYDLCDRHRTNYGVFMARMKHDVPFEKAFDDYPMSDIDKAADIKKIFKEYDGCEYHSIKEIYTKYNVSRQSLYYRYNSGWTVEEIVTYKK